MHYGSVLEQDFLRTWQSISIYSFRACASLGHLHWEGAYHWGGGGSLQIASDFISLAIWGYKGPSSAPTPVKVVNIAVRAQYSASELAIYRIAGNFGEHESVIQMYW